MAPFTPLHRNSDSEYEDSVYSSSGSEDGGAGPLLAEPEIKFTEEELCGLQVAIPHHTTPYRKTPYHTIPNITITIQVLVAKHNDQYKSVNFGETLIKEMIMCR